MYDIVLVDTSAWICFFARRNFPEIKKAISALLDENRVAIAGPILVELIQGAKNIAERENIKKNIKGLQWLSITDDHWFKSSELSFDLRRKGVTISPIDSILSIVAISYSYQLLHRDTDFELISKHSPLKLFKLH